MSIYPETPELWHGNRREDGLTVVEALDHNWIVLAVEGGAAIAACPVCGTPLTNAHTARRVADMVYPVARGEK